VLALLYLEQAGRDARLSSTAAYFLADAWLMLGNTEQAQRQAAVFLAQGQVPAQYRDHARAHRQAAAQYLAGKRQDANAAWMDMVEKSANKPELLAEVVLACVRARADCAKFEQRAVTLADAGEGKNISS